MPAATNKADLLVGFDKELAKVTKTLDGLDEKTAGLHAVDDETTIKGILAHRIHWVDLFFGWYEGGKAGKKVEIPAPGVKWNQLKPYNAPIYAAGNERSLADLRKDFDAQFVRLRKFLEAQDDAELYTPDRYAWTGKWGVGRWAESTGPAHFRSANTYIRKVLRDNKS